MDNAVKLSKRIMGGTFGVMAWVNAVNDKERVESLIEEGFALLCALEDKLTDFRDSPFNLINAHAGEASVKVDEEIFSLIEEAQKISADTEGAFDISYASVGHLWRNARLNGVPPTEESLADCSQYVDYRQIILDKKNLTVYLPHKKMRIGLGGIGKGYAVDRLYHFLVEKGLVNFLVDGAGDVRVHSSPSAPRPWRLSIRNPFSLEEKKNIGVAELKDGSIATSGDYINYIEAKDGKKLHHIIDPASGRPTDDIVSATILAPTALMADTMATSVIVMNRKKGLSYLNKKNIVGVLVAQDGTVLLSERALKMMSGKNK